MIYSILIYNPHGKLRASLHSFIPLFTIFMPYYVIFTIEEKWRADTGEQYRHRDALREREEKCVVEKHFGELEKIEKSLVERQKSL